MSTKDDSDDEGLGPSEDGPPYPYDEVAMKPDETEEYTCPICGEYSGGIDSVEAHITGMSDGEHKGKVGSQYRNMNDLLEAPRSEVTFEEIDPDDQGAGELPEFEVGSGTDEKQEREAQSQEEETQAEPSLDSSKSLSESSGIVSNIITIVANLVMLALLYVIWTAIRGQQEEDKDDGKVFGGPQ